MKKNKKSKVVKTESTGRDRSGKMSFIRALLTRKQNKVTRLEAIDLFLAEYPNCGGHKPGSAEARKTATNTVSWTAMDLKRKGKAVTLLPKVSTAGQLKPVPAKSKSKPGKKAPAKKKAPARKPNAEKPAEQPAPENPPVEATEA